jgi:hypothetical protein
MKFLAALAFLAPALFTQDTARIQELLQNLDDDSFEVREAAQRALIEIGPAAIPALKAVLADADRNPEKAELKIRATSALRGIEFAVKAKQYYVEPKRVTLHARDADVGPLLADLEKQSGVRILPGNINAKAKVSLDADAAPLLQVLDGLCSGAEDLAYELRDNEVRFSPARFLRCPSAYEGPYRFRIVRLRHEHSTDFKTAEGQVELAIESDWQRSLKPSRKVDLDLRTVVDDKGAVLELAKSETEDEGSDLVVMANGRVLGRQVRIRPEGDDRSAPVQSLTFKGLKPGATRISIRGRARFRFPLEKSELVFEKPASGEPVVEGSLSFSFRNQGATRIWKLTLTQVQGAPPMNPEDLDGRIDVDSFVAVDDTGKTHPATLNASREDERRQRVRGAPAPAGAPLAEYQVVFPTLEERTVKTIRFKYLSQVFVKTVPFAFADVPLP